MDRLYEINGYDGYMINKKGEVFSKKNNIYVKPFYNELGYKRVSIYQNSRRQKFFVHRLLAIVFIPNPNNYPVVNHIDCNINNNSIENLEWCTISHNTKHAWDNGRITHVDKLSKNALFQSQKLSKIVLNKESGVYFDSIKDAATSINIHHKTLSLKLKGSRFNNTNLILA